MGLALLQVLKRHLKSQLGKQKRASSTKLTTRLKRYGRNRGKAREAHMIKDQKPRPILQPPSRKRVLKPSLVQQTQYQRRNTMAVIHTSHPSQRENRTSPKRRRRKTWQTRRGNRQQQAKKNRVQTLMRFLMNWARPLGTLVISSILLVVVILDKLLDKVPTLVVQLAAQNPNRSRLSSPSHSKLHKMKEKVPKKKQVAKQALRAVVALSLRC